MAKAVKVVGESGAPRFSLRAVMGDELNSVEKQSKLTNAGFGRKCKRLSTGVAALDMMLDGGLVPGGWYTIAGPEQAGKSTLTMTLVAACIKQAFTGIGAVFDYEGSSDEDYIMSMFRNFGLTKVGIEDVFGIQDPETGKYIKEGFFRYYAPTLGESFFSYMSMMRRRLPDKYVTDSGESYFVFPNTKKNMTLLKGKYDTEWFRKYNTFRVECDDTSMQLLVVVDSYPAMLPEQQDDDDPSAAMALQARMFSDGIKRFRGSMRSKMMTIFGVNQLREKPAVQHGDPSYEPCFVGSTPVHLADGTVDTIRNIVLKKRKVKVLSFNKETGEVSAKRIIGWKDNGNRLTSDLVKVSYHAFDHNGCQKVADFVSTKEHKVWTPSGWKRAGELRTGDDVFINVPRDSYSTDQQQIIYGALLGDGVFDSFPRSISWNLTYNHVRYQVPYMMWKAQALDFGDVFDIPNDSNVQRYKPEGKQSQFSTFRHFNPTVAKYARALRSNHTVYGKKQIAAAMSVLSKIDLRGLAVWYMDDGHFGCDRKNGMWTITIACDRFTNDLKERAIEVIYDLTGVRARIHPSHGKLHIAGKSDCLKFQSSLADYIHPAMSYKLYDCASAGSYGWQQRDPDVVNTMVKTKVVAVGAPDIKSKYARVYDLTVEDNHTYFVGGSPRNCDLADSRVRRSVRADGIAVSNCGNALKFFCVDPTTLVETKNGWCTAQQYMDMHGDQDVLPAIRCPHTDGYVVPSKVFQSDGGEYKELGALSITTGQGLTLSGSAGHSILTCCPREFQMFDGATTVPDIRWTRMCNIEKIPQPWVFIDPVMLDHPVEVGALWETFLGACAPLVLKHCAIVNDIPDVGPHIEQQAVNALAAGDMELQEYEDFMCQHAFIEELVHVYLQLGANNVLVPDVCVGVLKAETPTHYIDFCTEGSWISGGIVSHNSDVRIRTMGRAIPDGFAGERGVVEEPSVEFEGRVDRYKFVSGRTHKNKLGGIPNQEFWFRIWEADGKGRARGIDPVYDTWWYLKKVGLLAGTRNKLKFLAPCPLAGANRAINWQELKSLVSGNKQQITDVCTDIGVKPVNVRNWVFSFTRSEAGRQVARDSIVAKIKATEDEE